MQIYVHAIIRFLINLIVVKYDARLKHWYKIYIFRVPAKCGT